MTARVGSIVLATLVASTATSAPGQTPDAPERAVVEALRANPLLLPYPIRVTAGKSGEIILSGKVGSRALHDEAIRTVLDMGLVPHDALTIDTAEAYRVAAEQVQNIAPASYFVYPPPLFGRIDEPFWGMEPPVVSFPPGYARRAGPSVAASRPATTPEERMRRAAAPPIGKIDLAVDEFGQVHLSGVAASEEDKRRIEEEAMRTPGVTRVSSELKVLDRATPPPPPLPFDGKPIETMPADEADAQAEPPPPPADPSDANVPDALSARIEQALERRPALKGLKFDASVKNAVVTLRGKVPSAYEAMLAFRAVERTPGVRAVVDELEFPLPDENSPNPLPDKARPDDLEPYLLHQIRRHAGEAAHVDRVDVIGDLVKVRGSLAPGESPDRMGAILRSMPLLRDFRVESTFSAD
ncbi:BON domain-containing protein [Paludisphaera sp.]|uniref:BON domain-containing protein n=1 Tax=Paludisphaera sp. TaxID=2017432 RepID=UPI00301B6DA9